MRLPVNVFSGRGIIIGEGKAENHNSAMPYITSELLQVGDVQSTSLSVTWSISHVLHVWSAMHSNVSEQLQV